MAALLVIAHAPLASALQAVAAHVYPDCGPSLQALDVLPGMGPEQVLAEGRAALVRLGADEVLVLTDVFGATPCNAALELADGQRVRVVAGVNVPMLWRTLCYVHLPLEELVARAVAGGSQGVMQLGSVRRQNQAAHTAPTSSATTPHDDQVQHHHQQ
jgi:PTS system ascorbate-specific IIA component